MKTLVITLTLIVAFATPSFAFGRAASAASQIQIKQSEANTAPTQNFK